VSVPALPLDLFDGALTAAGQGREYPLRLVDSAGTDLGRLPVERYLGAADEQEIALLASLPGPVLDIGCGPGRHVGALSAAGVPALGIDLSEVAVRLARRRGAPAVLASVFAEVPAAGDWGSALLLDGNIGIGGDPVRLLARVKQLVRPHGSIVVELDDGTLPGSRQRVRLEGPGIESSWFRWGGLGTSEVAVVAAGLGLAVVESHSIGRAQVVCLEAR
jgi:SAM-dependent methyltransferase